MNERKDDSMFYNRQLSRERLEHRTMLAADVYISEFVASNSGSLLDEDNESSDWIELYNAGTESVNLTGWHLTDDIDRLRKWNFPAVELPPDSFLVVFASDKDRTSVGSPLHTNFKLDADGEYLALTHNGAIVSEFSPTFPSQFSDVSYGVTQIREGSKVDRGLIRFFEEPTPNAINPESGKAALRADHVLLSHPSGFYEDSFSLALTTNSPATIRYTLDGSEPTTTHGHLYRTPVSISKTSTIRARAFQSTLDPGIIVTSTYLFLDDIIEQSANGRPPQGFPTATTINGQRLDYGMDPDIVDDATWGPQMVDALQQIPTMSVVMDVQDLLGAREGIYTNAGEHGRDWERAASIELIQPDGSSGFQVLGGVRVRGGFSRSDSNPKHAFRFFFREEWGDRKLEFPLFGEEGADEFDSVDLRTSQNYSWSFRGDGRNTFLRDVFARDLQRELGQPYTRSRYYHLYLNGQYWGLYQTQERAEASFAETYFGGDKSQYDVVKSSGSSGRYENEATDGSLDAYRRLADLFYRRGGLSDNVAYYQAQGLNADGSRNPDLERLLDVENLIDFAITTYFTGDRDGPVSRFVNGVNNYFAIYNREQPDGFKFFEHDSEHTLDVGFPDLAEQGTSNGSQFRYFNPLWMHEQLARTNADYQLRFADRLFELTRPGGILSEANLLELFDSRVSQIDTAIIAESARWGDAKREQPFTKDDWLAAVANVRRYFVDRAAIMLEQFRGLGWLPTLERPIVQVEGEQRDGGPISMSDEIALLPSDSIRYDESLIPERSTWKYLDDGSNQDTEWRAEDFDDTSWHEGRGQLGYGEGDETTKIRFGSNNAKHITTYFRKTFDVPDPSRLAGLSLGLLRDDGAIVYLNGKEVVRSNMASGSVSFDTLAAHSTGGAAESVYYRFALDPTVLRPGQNVLAVELHQVAPTTTDASFDLSLTGGDMVSSRQTIYYTLDGSDPRLPDGQVNPNAIRFSREFSIVKSATLRSRSRSGSMWSPERQVSLEVIDPPLEAVDDVIVVKEGDVAESLRDHAASVLANDLGLHNGPVRVSRVASPKYSRDFQLHADGTFSYAHDGSEQFTDSFRYRVTDAHGKSDTATVLIEVIPASDATPNAVDDVMVVDEGLQTSFLSSGRSVLDNDQGLLDTPIAVRVVREPRFAQSFDFDDDGTFVYHHDGSETRSDSFAYRIEDSDGQFDVAEVQITIRPRSDVVPRPKPDTIVVEEGQTATVLESGAISLLENDLGIIDSPFVVSIKRKPAHAAELVLYDDGTFSYTHDGSPGNADSFSYEVRDFDGEVGTATVSVNIVPVNSGPPIAVDDEISVREGALVTRLSTGERSVLANDVSLVDPPFQVTVGRPPEFAASFSLNSDGTFSYRHDNSEAHFDSFQYVVHDSDGDSDVGEVAITVTPVSDARPLARDDSVSVLVGSTTSILDGGGISLLQNDIRLDDGPIVVSLVSPPQRAKEFVLNEDGTFEYSHDGSGLDADAFQYQIRDNDGQVSVANVDIAIQSLFGDLDFSGTVDVSDVDLLVSGIRSHSDLPRFELTGDNVLDQRDLDYLIENVLRTRRGDTDLDGDVDFADFLKLSASFGNSNSSWEDGTFDLDGAVGFADFLVLSQYFGLKRSS